MPRLKSVGTVPSDPTESFPRPSERKKNDLTPALLQPHPRPLSEWNNPTQPPPRGGVPNGSRLGKGILNTKRAFLHIEETPSLLQGNALFILKRAFLYLENMPTCRDRHPRLSARTQQIKASPRPSKGEDVA